MCLLNSLLDWLNTNAGAITAFATAIIAWFTVSLRNVSDRQARLISDQIKLAREEFNATHRPKIVVRKFFMLSPELKTGEPVRYKFIAHNVGDAAGTIVELRHGTMIGKTGTGRRQNSGFSSGGTVNIPLARGEHREIIVVETLIADNESMEIYAGDVDLICAGAIVYADVENTRRETGYSRRYMSRTREWIVMSEDEYEYAY